MVQRSCAFDKWQQLVVYLGRIVKSPAAIVVYRPKIADRCPCRHCWMAESMGSLGGQVRTQLDDANTFVFAKTEHGFVSRNDNIGARSDSAFEYPVVWFVVEYGHRDGRRHELRQIGQEDSCARKLLALAGELTRKDGQELIENWL